MKKTKTIFAPYLNYLKYYNVIIVLTIIFNIKKDKNILNVTKGTKIEHTQSCKNTKLYADVSFDRLLFPKLLVFGQQVSKRKVIIKNKHR